MLSRGSSDASTRLKHAKSSSSVKKRRNVPLVQEPIDPETARQHALTAASRAMQRANERNSTDLRQSDISRNNSTTSRNGGRLAAREQAIRFNGKTALQRQQTITRTQPSETSTTLQTVYGGSPGHFITAIPQVPEEFGIEDGVASTPSSYRRLRKAKSMFTPMRQMSSALYSTTPASGGASSQNNEDRHLADGDHRVRLGLRRSLSFLKGGSEHLSRAFRRTISNSHSQSQDAAIQMARDQFLHDLEQQRLRDRPSFIFAPKTRRQQKAFRKTVRTSSTNSYGNAIASSNQDAEETTKENGMAIKARSLSISIKNKFKRAFRRSSTVHEDLPAQQLDASRAHFRDYVNPGSGISGDFQDVPALDGNVRSSYYPSICHTESIEDFNSRPGSIRTMGSLESLPNSKSRVTSWTNSTVGTMASRQAIERKRLSIIQEHGGPHQPSSSAGRHNDGYSAFKKPLRTQYNPNRHSGVDSQRIYSALMKRLDETSSQSDKENKDPEEADEPDRPSLARTSSERTYRTAPTIRPVASDASMSQDKTESQTRRSTAHSQALRKSSYPGDNLGLTPQQVAHHNESMARRCSGQRLREVKSAFFPFSTELKPETPSPFKLAMAARQDRQLSSDEESGSVIVSPPIQHGSTAGPSTVYSRTTSGQTPLASDSEVTIIQSESGAELGTATIIVPNRRPSSRRSVATTPKSHGGELKAKSSGDFKMWATSQMAGLDRQSSRKFQQKHYRENAQIDGDDTQVGKGRYSSGIPVPSQSYTSSQQSVFERPSPVRQSSDTMVERFPLMELKSVPRHNVQGTHRQSSNYSTSNSRGSTRRTSTNNENQRLSTAPILNSKPNSIRVRASQSSLASARKSSNPSPANPWGRYTTSSSFHNAQTQNNATPGRHMVRPQSSATLRSQYVTYSHGTPSPQAPGFKGRINTTNENMPTFGVTEGYSGDDEAGGAANKSSVAGARRMVDMFLSSRRRIARVAEEGNGEGAFL